MRNFICDVHLSSSTGTQAVVDVVVRDHSQAMYACVKVQTPVAVQTHAYTNHEFIGCSSTFPAQSGPKLLFLWLFTTKCIDVKVQILVAVQT